MAAFTKVMDSIVILDDDDAQDPSSSSWHPQTACMSSTSNIPQPPAAHIAESPFASTKKESHVLKVENEKLFGEVGECVRERECVMGKKALKSRVDRLTFTHASISLEEG